MKKQKILTRKSKLRVGRFTAVLISLSLVFQTIAVADNVLPEQLSEKTPQLSDVLTEDSELWEMDLVCEDESLR